MRWSNAKQLLAGVLAITAITSCLEFNSDRSSDLGVSDLGVSDLGLSDLSRDEMRAPTFATVQAAIRNKSCATAAACHAVGTTTMLTLSSTDANANYTTLATGSGKYGPFINLAAPETSNILIAPATAAKHNGAPSWATTDNEFQAVLAWLKSGAPRP